MNNRGKLVILMAFFFILPGCYGIETKTQSSDQEDNPYPTSPPIPEYLNLVADTAERDIDRGSSFNILEDADGANTMILWVSTGCSGCHDWTEMIVGEMDSGNISSDIRIISVHRYPSFETKQEVIDVYASENSSTNSPWPVLIPYDGQPAIDVEKNNDTEYDYSEAFENPATPSFTILDGDGKTIWKNRTYWANQTVLDEALEYLD